jgi:hypothetical protein
VEECPEGRTTCRVYSFVEYPRRYSVLSLPGRPVATLSETSPQCSTSSNASSQPVLIRPWSFFPLYFSAHNALERALVGSSRTQSGTVRTALPGRCSRCRGNGFKFGLEGVPIVAEECRGTNSGSSPMPILCWTPLGRCTPKGRNDYDTSSTHQDDINRADC